MSARNFLCVGVFRCARRPREALDARVPARAGLIGDAGVDHWVRDHSYDARVALSRAMDRLDRNPVGQERPYIVGGEELPPSG